MSSGELMDYVVIVGAIAFAISTVFTQWRFGASKVSAETLNAYELRDKQRDKEVEDLHRDIKELNNRVSELTGIVKEKDDRIKSLELVLQGRDPEMQAFMTKVGNVTDLFTQHWPTIEAIVTAHNTEALKHEKV